MIPRPIPLRARRRRWRLPRWARRAVTYIDSPRGDWLAGVALAVICVAVVVAFWGQ